MEQRTTTILAVDDDAVNLEIIQESLAEAEYQIVTASDGEQAWALLQEDPDRFDAVLLDRMMPKMNGMALLALMQADPAIKSRLEQLGVGVIGSSPEELRAYLKAEMDKWGVIIKEAGIKVE